MGFTVTLVRHGQSTMNFEKKIQTFTDAHLSELGERQSILLGEYLSDEKFNEVYSSDRTRALQTAQHILSKNKHKPIPEFRLDNRLRERDFGEWEGKGVELLHKASAEAGVRMHRFNEGTGETYEDFRVKCFNFFKELCEEKMKSSDVEPNILICSHGGWILTFFDILLETPDKFISENLEINENIRSPLNTSFSKMRIEKIDDGASNSKFFVKFSTVCDNKHLQNIS